MTLNTLLQCLKNDGHLDDRGASRIWTWIADQKGPSNYPWFIKVAIAFGAWVAAICFLTFLGAISFFSVKTGLLVVGIITIICATGIRSLMKFEFTNQLALASSIAGHCLIFIWMIDRLEWSHAFVSLAITSAVLCAVLYPLYRDVVHRFLSCFLCQLMFLIWLGSLDRPNTIYVLIGVQTLLILFLFAGRSFTGRGLSTAERPLAYASAAGLIVSIGVTTFLPELPVRGIFMILPAKILFTAVLIYLYVWATRREGRKWNLAMTTAVVITVALGIMATPGILVAIMLMVIGYEREDHLMVGLGIAIFPIFIWFYYYNLNLNFMTKSFILMGSGAILLAARLYMGRFSSGDSSHPEAAIAQGAGQ